ncbi:GtrA family protein [Pseudomonas sp. P66]|uniref:GtrA family protein n=1 Tax=Pseudomonas arcuscaelestis TaxID=2710591 RepID=A0ABS2C6Q3_9PSED|nr:GtrA family protein [Pseudomonas arcuscaelestis]MBM5461552.1 GtrA family protein [Pseudomonas arcuscaelestis]
MIRRELSIFLVVGSLTVLVDFLSYRGLVGTGIVTTDWAKGLGFLAGTIFAYFANRFWTFNAKVHARGSAIRFGVLYTVTLVANIAINRLALWMFAADIHLAFLLATGVSAALNFLGMKHFVFKVSEPKEAL